MYKKLLFYLRENDHNDEISANHTLLGDMQWWISLVSNNRYHLLNSSEKSQIMTLSYSDYLNYTVKVFGNSHYHVLNSLQFSLY